MGNKHNLFRDIIRAISRVIDFDERSKRNHSQRVAIFSFHIADALGLDAKGDLFYAGLLHDIGSIGSESSGFGSGRSHSKSAIQAHIDKSLAILNAFKLLHPVLPYIANHHEHYDGSGFPAGTSGTEAELSYQILPVADMLEGPDCKDAASFSNHALRVLREQRGRTLHPKVADAATALIRNNPELMADLFCEKGLHAQISVLQPVPRHLEHFSQDQIMGQLLCLLAQIIDMKHMHTLGHSIRVAFYSSQIAEALGDLPINRLDVLWAGLLHDVGIVKVPSSLLLKPGPFTGEELIQLEAHAEGTEEIIATIGELAHLAKGAGSHHEHFDGSGYPRHLAGEEIPLLGRILAYGEMYDSLTSDRNHRKGLASDKAIDLMRQRIGSILDPTMAETAFEVLRFFGRHPLHFEESVMTFKTMIQREVSSLGQLMRGQRKLNARSQLFPTLAHSPERDSWDQLQLDETGEKVAKGLDRLKDLLGLDKGPTFLRYFTQDCNQDLQAMLCSMNPGESLSANLSTSCGKTLTLLTHKQSDRFQVFYRVAGNLVQSMDQLVLFYRSYFKSSEAVVFTDAHGKMMDANQKFLDLHGLTLEQAQGHDLSIVKSGLHSPSFYKTLWETISDPNKGFWSGEIVNCRLGESQKVFLYLTIHSIRDSGGTLLGFIGHAVDMTAQKRVSEALHEKKRELENSNLQLLELTKLKSDLMAITSHDLKVPLNSILQLAYFAREALSHAGETARLQALDRIEAIVSTGQRMADFIQEVLDAESYESGSARMRKRPIQLDNLLRECVGTLRTVTNPAVNLSLKVEAAHGPSFLDPVRMRQVFENLISNALKFSPEEGEVAIVYRENSEGDIEIEIADQGPGIPEQELETIFDRFVQGRKRIQGSGLGLFIVRQILQHHGGTIKARNRKSAGHSACGAIFTITLPRAPEPGKEVQFALVVGPRRELAPFLEKPLRQRAVDVGWVTDEYAASSLYHQRKPSLIFYKEGALSQSFLNQVIQDPNSLPPSIILLTQDWDTAKPPGIDVCLTFPIIESEVFNTLDYHAQKKHLALQPHEALPSL